MTSPDQPPSAHLRLAILIVVIACLFSALFARLLFLQVMNAPKARAVAADNGVRLLYVQAPRGRILDRNGDVLVGNVNEPVIEVSRQQAAQNPGMVTRLAALLGMTVKQLDTAINNLQYSPYAPVPVMPDASPEQILYVQEHQELFPGVQATSMSVRTYSPAGKASANLVGYVGQISSSMLSKLKAEGYQAGDQIGLAGVEAAYEKYLRGTPGVQRVQVDSSGHVLAGLSGTAPVPGDDLKLSIDGNIQMVAQKALAEGLDAARQTFDSITKRDFAAPAGSAVVEDPKTGQILALATDPTYDPSQFVGGISESNYKALLNNPSYPLLDRTIQGAYAPGSTFKLVTATAGLEYGLVTPDSIFDDTGSIQIGNFTAHNDNGAAYGPINLAQAITVSSDNYFNTIGLKLWYNRQQYGTDALQKVAKLYGFGTPTAVALPNESAGKVPTPESYVKDHQSNPAVFQQSQWYPGNSDQLAIGQDELLVTPLQLANAYATFANGGTRFVPQLALDTQTAAGKVNKIFPPKPVADIGLKPEWRSAMLAGFEGVVDNPNGTAFGVFSGAPVSAVGIAGKTGTAQVNAPRQATSVFTSFAPVSNPRYVVDAFMEDSGYGASVAAPVVREIYDALFHFPLQPVAYSATGAGGQN